MTKEKILDKYYKPRMHWKSVNRQNVLRAMGEYAEQQQKIHYQQGCKDGFADGEFFGSNNIQ